MITAKVINVGLGDFNRDVLNNSNRHLASILSQCKLIVTKPTYISGSLIYHVYASNHSLHKLCVKILSIFFLIIMPIFMYDWSSLNLFKMTEGECVKKSPPTNFSREISTNAAITSQNLLHFNFNFFATLA